jgi:hypothetical protein
MQPHICNLAFVLVKATWAETFASIRLLSMIVNKGVTAGWSHIYGICRHPLIQHRLRLGQSEPWRSSFWMIEFGSISAFSKSGIKLGVVEPSGAGERSGPARYV